MEGKAWLRIAYSNKKVEHLAIELCMKLEVENFEHLPSNTRDNKKAGKELLSAMDWGGGIRFTTIAKSQKNGREQELVRGLLTESIFYGFLLHKTYIGYK